MTTATKTRILDAAEQLFADHGFANTSMRDITAAAEVNLAAVNYHFGSKESLFIAVMERGTVPLNQERLRRLDTLETTAGSTPLGTEELVRAFLTPMFEVRSGWSEPESKDSFLKLVGRSHTGLEPTLHAKLVGQYEEVIQRFSQALVRSLPHLEPADLIWRTLFLIGSMSFTMSWAGTVLNNRPQAQLAPQEILEELIQFTAKGLSAPPRFAGRTQATPEVGQ